MPVANSSTAAGLERCRRVALRSHRGAVFLVLWWWSILVAGESASVSSRAGEWSGGGDTLSALGLSVCVKLWADTARFTEAICD
jgi:hypothetical protein